MFLGWVLPNRTWKSWIESNDLQRGSAISHSNQSKLGEKLLQCRWHSRCSMAKCKANSSNSPHDYINPYDAEQDLTKLLIPILTKHVPKTLPMKTCSAPCGTGTVPKLIYFQTQNENIQDEIGVSREVPRSHISLQANTTERHQRVQCQDEGKTR